jgi:ribosomal protein L13E
VKKWLDRLFARTQVRLAPQATLGREVPYVASYSLLELERAGLTAEQAIAAGVAIDRKRDSALGSNVIQLEKLRRARGWKRT